MKGWALRRKAHTFECAVQPADLGDGRDAARQQAAAHRLVLGRLPDGDPLQRHLCPAAPDSSVSALTAALGCSPTSCLRVDPVQPAWWKSTIQPSGPKSISGHRRAIELGASQAACGASGHVSDPSSRKPTAGPATPVPADRRRAFVGKTAAHLVLPWIHQVFSNLKGWARGVYHTSQASAGLSREFGFTLLSARSSASPPMQNPLPSMLIAPCARPGKSRTKKCVVRGGTRNRTASVARNAG